MKRRGNTVDIAKQAAADVVASYDGACDEAKTGQVRSELDARCRAAQTQLLAESAAPYADVAENVCRLSYIASMPGANDAQVKAAASRIRRLPVPVSSNRRRLAAAQVSASQRYVAGASSDVSGVNDSADSASNVGAIVGSVIGVLFFVLALAGGVIYVQRR